MKHACLSGSLVLLLLLCLGAVRAAEEPPAEMVKMVLDLVGDKDKDMRGAGLDQVRTEMKGAAATRHFAEALPKLAPEAQVGLLGALADRGDGAARPAVMALLATKPAEPVRVAALTALGSLGEPADLTLLIETLGAGSEAEQGAAKASLGRLKGDKVNAAIAGELKGASPAVRSALIDVLSTRRAYDIIPSLVPGTVDADQAVRLSSMAALAQLAGPDQIPSLLQGVLRAEEGAEREAAEKTVINVCGRSEDKSQRAAPVLAAYAKLGADHQLALLSLLGRLGGPEVLPTLEAALESGDAARRQAALEALGLWPSGAIAEKLFTLTQNAADADDRAVAFRALMRVSALRDERTDQERFAQLKNNMELAQKPSEKGLVLNRCRTAYTIESLRFVLPYVDDPKFSAVACETVVELAHQRALREPNKAEFDAALDKVLATSQDEVVKDRAQRYKVNQTWERPKNMPPPAIVVDDETELADALPAGPSPGLMAAIAGGVALVLLALLALRRKSSSS